MFTHRNISEQENRIKKLRMESAKGKELTPERVMQILKRNGTPVDMEEAKIIAEFIKKLAHIAVNQYLKDCL